MEIGPADTLAAMMKKTLDSQYRVSDAAASTKRTVLSYARDASKIQYDEDSKPAPRKKKDPEPAKQVPEPAKPKDTVTVQVVAPQPLIVVQESAPTLDLPDVPVLAEDIVLAIMAPKLKKPFADIDKTKSIKQLTGGESHSLWS